MKRFQILCALIVAGTLLWRHVPAGHAAPDAVYYVAVGGSDSSGNGSFSKPWASIEKAVESVPDGSTILVRPGTYTAQTEFYRWSEAGITIRSEVPYQARLRYDGPVMLFREGSNLVIEGFDMAHSGPGAQNYVIQIQDTAGVVGGCSDTCTHNITLRNNILHDSYANDIVKINEGVDRVTLDGNILYNPGDGDEHIDINSATNITLQDNILFNDFEGSGRSNSGKTCSFIVTKDSNADGDEVLGSHGITIRRNILLNWQGYNGSPIVGVGEDGQPFYEGYDILVENNLFLGNSSQVTRAAFGVRGGRDITFRSNTVYGNLPSLAFAMRLNRQGENPINDNLWFYNNIWADPTGTMEDFSDASDYDFWVVEDFALDNNLYWNNGNAIPYESYEEVNFNDEKHPVLGDPQLGALPGKIPLPRLLSDGTLADGSATARQAFINLVERYAHLPESSAALDAADPAHVPADDILGNPRSIGVVPDLGAYERPAPAQVENLRITHAVLYGAALSLDLAWTPAEGTTSVQALSSHAPITLQNWRSAVPLGDILPGDSAAGQFSLSVDPRRALYLALRSSGAAGDSISNNAVLGMQRLHVPLAAR